MGNNATLHCCLHKPTGGRLWNKPWGIPKLTKTQKENRRKQTADVRNTVEVLKLAAARDPAVLAARTTLLGDTDTAAQ